jgi:hypothetical protein
MASSGACWVEARRRHRRRRYRAAGRCLGHARNLCTFVWTLQHTGHTPAYVSFIYNFASDIYTEYLNYPTLEHLDDLGMINFNPDSGYSLTQMPPKTSVAYHSTPIEVWLPEAAQSLGTIPAGQVMLTRAGRELASICTAAKYERYFQSVLDIWLGSGYALSSPVPVLTAQKSRRRPRAV